MLGMSWHIKSITSATRYILGRMAALWHSSPMCPTVLPSTSFAVLKEVWESRRLSAIHLDPLAHCVLFLRLP